MKFKIFQSNFFKESKAVIRRCSSKHVFLKIKMVKLAKFLRTQFFTEPLQRLLLKNISGALLLVTKPFHFLPFGLLMGFPLYDHENFLKISKYIYNLHFFGDHNSLQETTIRNS